MKPDPDQLEQLIHHTVRGLPNRRAPRELERRVLAELAARADRPWWRDSFAQWPLSARIGFFLLGAVVAKLVLVATVFAMSGFDAREMSAVFAEQHPWVEATRTLAASVWDAILVVFAAIPRFWLYAVVGFVAALYAALFGLGAAAYRTLYAHR